MSGETETTTGVIEGPDELRAAVGTQLGTSDWLLVDQSLINRYADVTGDDYWGHTDPIRSQDTPFGGTIAHGLLILALHPRFLYSIVEFRGFAQMFHYGYDRVRFPGALLAGDSVRVSATLQKVEPVAEGLLATISFVFQNRRSEKPVCVADYLQYFTFRDSGSAKPAPRSQAW